MRRCFHEPQTHHADTSRPEYYLWTRMRVRCANPHDRQAKDYFERGIGVCDRWRIGEGDWSGYDLFLQDMGPRPTPSHTLDRVDNDRGYSPENCRWATWQEQHANKRTTPFLEAFGQRKTLMQWAADLGLEPPAIRRRLQRGWPIERALTPLHFRKGGKRLPISTIASRKIIEGSAELAALEGR